MLHCRSLWIKYIIIIQFTKIKTSLVAQTVKHLSTMRERPRFDPWVRKNPWRRKWQSTPVLVPGKSHGQRSLVGYSPWGRRVGHDWATSLHLQRLGISSVVKNEDYSWWHYLYWINATHNLNDLDLHIKDNWPRHS